MRKHPYILATLIATLLAVVVWFCVPKEYTAVVKVSDEYEETDLAIGMTRIKADLRNLFGDANIGINNMDIYSKLLTSNDFVRKIAKTSISRKGQTYGEYLGEEDTINAVSRHLNYNYSNRQETLIISFTDRNPGIASQMLDSVTTQLQCIVTNHRHDITLSALNNARNKLKKAKEKYDIALHNYSTFADSNWNISTTIAEQKEESLREEVTLAYDHYEDASKEYARQQALLQRSYLPFAVIKSNSTPVKDNSHFASYLLSFICIALILTKICLSLLKKNNKRIIDDWGDFFSPWCLTVFIWTSVILLYFMQGELDPIGPNFIYCLTLWLITFLPCSIIMYWLSGCKEIKNANYHKQPININLFAFYCLATLSTLMTLLYAKTIWEIVSQFDLEDLLFNIRILAVGNGAQLGLLGYTQGINLALFIVSIWLYPRIPKWVIVVIIIINLILEFAMMEKSGILIMILGILFVLYERKEIKLRTIGITLLSIIVLFFFFNMSKEKADSDESATFMDFFGMYVTSPLVAFEKLRVTISDTFGTNTLNDFYPQLLRFGIKINVIERLQDFVYVPIPTNVYTIMQPFYNDFGPTGVAFFGFLYGNVFGYVYRKFREGSDLYKCFYTYLVEVILIQFYNENLLQIFHLVMETALIIILLIYLHHFNFTPSSKSFGHELYKV